MPAGTVGGGRRSDGNPLWNNMVVAGMEGSEPYLGFVDKIGVAYTERTIASGYGGHIALVRHGHCWLFARHRRPYRLTFLREHA
jgi:hypothetical protein